MENKTKSTLPDKVAIIFDGWADGNTYYDSVFATCQSDQPAGYDSVLLELTPMEDEDSLDANKHFELLQFIFQVFGESIKMGPLW